MFKSLIEMHKVMAEILKAIRDKNFIIDDLYSKYEKSDVDEAIFECIEKKLITGIKCFRSETNSVLIYPSDNPAITYEGLAFLKEK